MIQISSQSIAKGRMLNTNDTSLFISEIDELLKKFDFNGIIKLSKNYPFNAIDQEELEEFIERAEYEHKNWFENPLEIKINSVVAFETKCIACFHGKTIKAYQAEYNQMKDEKLPGRIIYTKSISIYFEIKNNELFDFGWCNAFLEKNEMEEIKN